MRYRVSHRTTYTYDDDVTDSFGLAYLTPRELPWQRVLSQAISVEPAAIDTATDVDHHGNTATYFQIDSDHRSLVVDAESEVDVTMPGHDPDALAEPWERARPTERADIADAWRAQDFVLASPSVEHSPTARDYAAASLLPGRPLGDAVADLMHRIHDDFAYEPGATTVTSTIEDLFGERAGVCQDFAHLTLACLRIHGLAARYVSGYIATDPPPGKERIVGADASHAWAAVWVPGDGWLALDPTNDQWVNDRYVTLAWGREYTEVPPLKGVIFTDAADSTLDVSVDVVPLG